MTCDRRLLSYYRDGGLSLEERYELECHLTGCSGCADELRGLMRLAQVVRSLPMVSSPPTLRDDVRRLIVERRIQPRRSILPAGWARSLAPAAVAASVAISALVAFRPGALDLPSAPAQPAPALSAAPAQSAPPVHSASLPSQAASSSAPAAAPAQSVTGQSAPAQSAAAGAGDTGSVASQPPFRPSGGSLRSVHVPVSQGGSAAGSLPTKLGNPAAVPGPIARLYSSNQQVRELLGEAAPGSRTVTLLEQSFQGGLAIWRSDTREIYVLRRNGNTWSVHPDTWRPGDHPTVEAAPPPGAMIPAGGFGTLWRSTPEVKSRLGWAVYEPRGSGGSVQTFERGVVVWTPHGLLYVLSNDGRWRTFPDATSF